MARTDVPVTTIVRAGVAAPTEVSGDSVNGHSTQANDGGVWLQVRNADTASHTLTMNITATVDGEAVTARTYTIAASGTKLIGPFPPAWYGSTLLYTVDSSQLKLVAYRLSPS